MIGPQVVKTTVRPHDGRLSPAARHSVQALFGLIAAGEDTAVLTACQMNTVEILALLLRTAGAFHEGEARLEEVLGALLGGAAWIAHREGTVFEAPQDPRPPEL